MTDFKTELTSLINKYSKENDCDTPDSIIAEYLCDCLDSYNATISSRDSWWGFNPWNK